MFFDEVSLELLGGRGGNGMVSFHREKFIAEGPPDGGDGGKGGSVILEADSNYNTFRHFSGKKTFQAGDGQGGHKNNRAGATGEDLILKVPIGTLVYLDEGDKPAHDFTFHGEQWVACEGGRGGYGNGHFASSVRQAPKFAELGDIGEKKEVRFEMRLIAEVGLVGFPSAGKSTLISHVSAAKPKIAAYPFTTLIPNLGVVNLSNFGGSIEQSFVLADIPGIIEGASEGRGLGDQFLKHISRSAVLVFLLDPYSYDGKSVEDQYQILREELGHYDADLLNKEFFVVLNKIDALDEDMKVDLQKKFLKKFPKLKGKFRLISGVSGEGLSPFMFDLWKLILAERAKQEKPTSPQESGERTVLAPKFFIDQQDYEIRPLKDLNLPDFRGTVHGLLTSPSDRPKRKVFEVTGKRIEQISRMTNTNQPDAVGRVYDVIEKMGIKNHLKRLGAKTGDLFKIPPHLFEYHELDE